MNLPAPSAPPAQPAPPAPPCLRADLHVHSYHSAVNGDLPFLRSRDCYSSPEAIYRTAKARGMDLVAITDHDSIDGCLELIDKRRDASDIIVGEEVTCWFPDTRLEVHLGVYGLNERHHRELQPLRRNAFELAEYLRGQGLFFSFNHLFHFFRHQVPLARYFELVALAPALEVQNGVMLPEQNGLIEAIIAAQVSKDGRAIARVAGSDAHTLRRVGRTWTSVPSRTRDEFLLNLRSGLGTAGGDHGSVTALSADIYGVIVDYWLSLVGMRRNELRAVDRLIGVSFSLASLPFEFIPLLVSAVKKSRESRTVTACARELSAHPASGSPAYVQLRQERPN